MWHIKHGVLCVCVCSMCKIKDNKLFLSKSKPKLLICCIVIEDLLDIGNLLIIYCNHIMNKW